MPNIGTLDTTLRLDTKAVEAKLRSLQQGLSRGLDKGGFDRMTNSVRGFEKTLGQATNRVVAFGAAAVVFNTLSRAAGSFTDSLVEVDKSLAEINVNLGQSTDGLKQFSNELFNVARQTGQTFETAAKAAAELARQGLSADETIKRLKDSLILSRIAGIDSAEAVNTLTAAINSFNSEALTSTEVVNKFAAVDTKFAVSSKDLAEAVSRVGSTAESAGVGIDQLIGLVTSLQQTTARGGATIGNGLKTIFTRIQAAPETVNALQAVGVAIKDTSGNLRSAIDILQDYGRAREHLGEAERQSLDRTIAGTFQINTLKAALNDLSKGYSIYDSALKTSVNATDEAIRKNEQLNQTLASLINSTAVSIKQLVAAIGAQDLTPVLKGVLTTVENIRKYLSGETGDQLGKSLGDGILRGLTDVLSGPVVLGIATVLYAALRKIFTTIRDEARALFEINTAVGARARIQERLLVLQQSATDAELAQLNAARSVTEQKEALIAVQNRLNRELLIGTELQNAFLVPESLGRARVSSELSGIKGFADPIASAMQRESNVSGLPMSQIYVDKDARVATFANPAGVLVANTRDEPLGGYQGVNRVISGGGNPKHGSIPGFALGSPAPDISSRNNAASQIYELFEQLKKAKPLSNEFHRLGAEIQDLSGSLSKISQNNVITRVAREFNNAVLITKGKAFNPANLILPGSDRASEESIAQNQAPQIGGIPGRPYSFGNAGYPGSNLRRSSNVFTGVPPLIKDIEQARAQEAAELDKRRRNAAFGLSFLAPFAAGFVSPAFESAHISTAGGTAGGRASGVIEGALSGTSLGVFGPEGAAIGALGGAVIGLLRKLSPSLEEFNEVIDKSTAQQQASVDAAGRVRSINGELAQGGLSSNAISRFQQQRASALLDVDPEFRSRLSKSGLSEEDQNKIVQEIGDKAERVARIGEVTKGSNALNSKGAFEKIADFLDSHKSLSLPGLLLGGASKGFRAITEDPFSGVTQARSIGKGLGGLITDKNVGDIDQSLIGRIISGKGGAGDFDKLAATYQKLGSGAEVTQDKQKEYAEALDTAVKRFKELSKIIADQKAGAQKGGLLSGSFLNPLNTEPFANAAALSRNPRAGRTLRGQARFNVFQELIGTGATSEQVLKGNPLYDQSKALAQSNNAADPLIAYLANAGYNVSKLKGQNGTPNLGAIQRLLQRRSKSGVGDAAFAGYLSQFAEQAQGSLTNAGLKAEVPFTDPLVNGNAGGITPGADYGIFTKARSRGGSRATYINNETISSYRRDSTQFITAEELNRNPYGGNKKGFDLVQGRPGPSADDQENQLSDDAQKTAVAYQKTVSDAKDAAQAAAQALAQTLNVVVTINGGDGSIIQQQMQDAIQSILNNQAASAGKPNPPVPPSTTQPNFMKSVNRVVDSFHVFN